MKKRNKFLALFLAAALSVSVTACGSSDAGKDSSGTPSASQDETGSGDNDAQNDDEQNNDVDPLAAAKENMADISSLNGKMVMEMDMDVSANGETQSIQTVTTMDMTYFADPLRMKVDMNVDAGETGSTSSSIYAETAEDGTCTMYVTDGNVWQSQSVTAEDLEQYNASSSMSECLESNYPFEADGTEQVDGTNAYKYTATLTGDEVKDALLSTGALDSFGSLGIGSDQLESMMSDLGDMPVSLWIDEESLYPVKYDIDMTSIMDSLISGVAESMADQAEDVSMSIPKMKFSMSCSNYNSAEDFTIPDEAKAAASAE